MSDRPLKAHWEKYSHAKLVSWSAAAALLWLAGFGLSEGAANGIAAYPQPDQILWVTFFRLVPLIPLFIAAGYACFVGIRRGLSLRVALRSVQVLLWGSMALIFLAVPKPN
jgi:hypothetical protein